MMMKIRKLQKVTSGGIVSGDYSGEVNKYYINVVFTMSGLDESERNIKVKVTDINYDEINFDDPNSISESMINDAFNQAYVKYACDAVDEEIITGNIDVDFEVKDHDGDTFNCKNDDVFQLRDITRMMPRKDAGVLCKKLLENKGVLSDDDLEDNNIESEEGLEFCNYSILEIEELINTVNKIGIVKIDEDTIMKGNGCIFINNDEFDGTVEEAIIYTITDGLSKMDLASLKAELLDLQKSNEDYYESCEQEELEMINK